MLDETPRVLIASVSQRDGHGVERLLKATGWNLSRVDDAEDAARHLDGDPRASVLVIDAGLLEMAHDAQWRVLRSKRPELGTVVLCLVRRNCEPERRDARTLAVHPDDAVGMYGAVRELGGAGLTAA